MSAKKQSDDWFPDPEPGDENDPAYKEEMFETLKFMKIKPEELVDLVYRAQYIKWLGK